MALIDLDAGLLVTAAPGTGSTALLGALRAGRRVRPVPTGAAADRAGTVDAKHGTVGQLVAAGLLPADHGLTIVTTTRNPFDFYVAEWERSRTRWVHELLDRSSWLHTQPGAMERLVDAVTLDFEPWLRRALGVERGRAPVPRRLNRGHVEEADVVLRMESLEADLLDRLGLRLTVAPQNVTERDRAYWRHYSEDGRALVQEAHAEDLTRFEYSF